MKTLLSFLEGYYIIEFEESDRGRVYDLLLKYRVRYSVPAKGKNTIKIPAGEANYFKEACKRESLDYKSSDKKGMPQILKKYRLRAGAFLGIAIFTAMIWMSGSYVWRIEVTGNETVPTGEVIKQLKENGFCEGDYIPYINEQVICSRIIEKSNDIAWISINYKGNIANVEIIELSRAEKEKASKSGTNLVAGQDALIESVDVTNGNPLIKKGQTVAKGDLLVSGVIDGLNETAFVNAEGKIMGMVTSTIDITANYKQTQKKIKNKKTSQISIIFFTKEINIFKYGGNLPPECDTIYNKEQIYLFGRLRLPVFIVKKENVEYQNEVTVINEKEAAKLAKSRLNDNLALDLREGELLKIKISGEYTCEGYHLVCVYDSVRNIAVPLDIKTSDQENK